MKIDKTLNKAVAGSALALLAVSGVAVADNHEATTTYKFGGYAKADVLFTSYSDATPDGNSLMRQFYWAPGVPVGDGTGDSDLTTDFQARETRLNFRVDHKTAGGSSVTAFVELDFFIDNNNSTR